MATLHALHLLENLISTATKVYTIGGEIFTATAILWALNLLASIVRKVYQTGRAVGYIYYRFIKPVLAMINWREVGVTVGHSLLATVLLTHQAGLLTGRAIYSVSNCLGQHWPTRPNTKLETIAEVVIATNATIEHSVTLPTVQSLRAMGISQRQIAAQLGITRYQVRKQLAIK
jgi:DNA-binding transcriptional regulator LsrR (DeoR family)